MHSQEPSTGDSYSAKRALTPSNDQTPSALPTEPNTGDSYNAERTVTPLDGRKAVKKCGPWGARD